VKRRYSKKLLKCLDFVQDRGLGRAPTWILVSKEDLMYYILKRNCLRTYFVSTTMRLTLSHRPLSPVRYSYRTNRTPMSRHTSSIKVDGNVSLLTGHPVHAPHVNPPPRPPRTLQPWTIHFVRPFPSACRGGG